MICCLMFFDYSNQKVTITAKGNDSYTILIKNHLFPSKLGAITIYNKLEEKEKIKLSLDFETEISEIVDRDHFEGDLSELTDRYSEDEINDKIIQEEIDRQYQELITTNKESENNLRFTGSKWFLPFSKQSIKIENITKNDDDISFQFNTYFGLISSTGFKKIEKA